VRRAGDDLMRIYREALHASVEIGELLTFQGGWM
jgi:hypothetical protein